MKKKVESFKFRKKKILLNPKKINNEDKYTERNGKEYSKIFIKILNANNPSNNKKIKKNNIKKITLFNPEESKLIRTNSPKNKSQKFIKKVINKNNKEKDLCNGDTKLKIKMNINKFKVILKTEEKNVNLKNIKNYNSKDLINNGDKIENVNHIIEKNLTEKNIKNKNSFQKRQIQPKEGNNHKKNIQNKKELKNNFKIKKIDILNDNSLPLVNKEKINSKKENLNYIFRQNQQKNYEIKKQTLPKITNIVTNKEKNKNKKNKLEKENRSERIINESLNIIDSFTSQNISLKDDSKNKKRTLEVEYYRNLSFYPKYIYTDITQSVPKLSNNSNTELNAMNSSKLNEIHSPSKLNQTFSRKLKLDTSRKNNKLKINKSQNIKIKINQKFQRNKTVKPTNTIFNVKKIENVNSSTLRKIVRIKFKNNGNNKKIINGDNDNGFYSEESYISKNEYPNYSIFNNSMNKESNKISLNKRRNYNKKHETVANNTDNISRKLLVLVNDFHNGIHTIEDNTFNLKSGKLIDRIRALKKLNNI